MINLPVTGLAGGFGRTTAPDCIARLASTDPIAAAAQLVSTFQRLPAEDLDWPDLLARSLLSDPRLELSSWPRQQGLAPETLSRGFRRTYGLTPRRFRQEAKARRALSMLAAGQTGSLVTVALDCGFADQAHMTHAIKALTGMTPDSCRRSSGYNPYEESGGIQAR